MSAWKYDEESLTYKKTRKVFRDIITYFISSVVLAIIYYAIFSLFFDTNKERELKTQYENLISAYDSVETNFKKASTVLEHLQEKDTMIYRSVFKTDPTGYVNSASSRFDLSTMGDYDIVKTTHNAVTELSFRIKENKVKVENSLSKINANPEKFRNIPAIQPVENKDLSQTGASVGMKMHPFYHIAKMHRGIDYTVPLGTKVIATADGVVSNIINDDTEKGMTIYIDHGNGYRTVYAHLSKFLVSRDSKVKRGKIIALSGDTGMSLFPHLHYEVWKNGKFVDPISCFFAELNPTELKKIIDISSNIGQSLD